LGIRNVRGRLERIRHVRVHISVEEQDPEAK
jgi:hypothetical protein